MRRDWAAAAQTKSRAESSGRGLVVVVEVLGGWGVLCGAAWGGGMGTAPGDRLGYTLSVFEGPVGLGRTGWRGGEGGGLVEATTRGPPQYAGERGGGADGG